MLPNVLITKYPGIFGGGGGGGNVPVPPHGSLYWYADDSGSIDIGAITAEGTEVTRWGTADTAASTPYLITDSVTGGPAIRFATSSAVMTTAGHAAFMSQAASSFVTVVRMRKYNYGASGPYRVFDSTVNGTTAGVQLTIYDNNADAFSRRLVSLRIFDGVSWILDKTFAEEWGHWLPQKWHAISGRVSGTKWSVRVDGKDLHFTEQVINISMPASATGEFALGFGPVDLKALELYNSYLSDADILAAENRLSARFGVNMIVPIKGLINVVTPPTPQYVAFPWATILPNGDIDVTCFNSPTTEEAGPDTFASHQLSTDGGITFGAAETIFTSDSTNSQADPHTLIMSNGHALRVTYTWDLPSDLGQRVWAQVSNEAAPPYTFPALTNITLPGSFYFLQSGGSPVEDPDNPGTILWALFGQVDALDTGWRCVFYKSTTFGSIGSWTSHLIVDGQLNGHQYSEPQLLFHTSGELRCLIRDYSGNGSPGSGYMVMTESDDKGTTWATVSAKVADANSAGQSYRQLASGREVWLGRPSGLQSQTIYSRPPGSAWDAAWADIPVAMFADPRQATEMVYGAIVEPTPGDLYQIWGAFTGNNPNTIADVSGWRLKEFYLTHEMPGVVSPSSVSLNVLATQQFAATGAGDFTWSINPNNSGGSINSSTGLYTAGSANGTDHVVATDVNGFAVTVGVVTVTGGSSAPMVTSIVPDIGAAAGGTAVTITGTGFTGASGATIGGVALTSFVVVSNTKITGVTGAHAVAASDVVVTNGSTGTLSAGYLYIPAVTLSLIGEIVTMSGPDVIGWPDQSGNGNDATPPSYNLTVGTIGGHPSVHSTGTGDVLTFASFTAGLTALELFVIGQNDADDGTNHTPYAFSDDVDGMLVPLGANRQIYSNSGSTTRQVTGFAPAAGAYAQPWLMNEIGTATEYDVNFNGVSAYTQGSNTFGYGTRKLFGGPGGSFAGGLAVVLLFPAKLSSGDHIIVQTFLKARHGIV